MRALLNTYVRRKGNAWLCQNPPSKHCSPQCQVCEWTKLTEAFKHDGRNRNFPIEEPFQQNWGHTFGGMTFASCEYMSMLPSRSPDLRWVWITKLNQVKMRSLCVTASNGISETFEWKIRTSTSEVERNHLRKFCCLVRVPLWGE